MNAEDEMEMVNWLSENVGGNELHAAEQAYRAGFKAGFDVGFDAGRENGLEAAEL